MKTLAALMYTIRAASGLISISKHWCDQTSGEKNTALMSFMFQARGFSFSSGSVMRSTQKCVKKVRLMSFFFFFFLQICTDLFTSLFCAPNVFNSPAGLICFEVTGRWGGNASQLSFLKSSTVVCWNNYWLYWHNFEVNHCHIIYFPYTCYDSCFVPL